MDEILIYGNEYLFMVVLHLFYREKFTDRMHLSHHPHNQHLRPRILTFF